MIGNISIATNFNELNFIIQTRLNTKVRSYMSNGIEAPKCKVIVIDDYCPKDDDNYMCASLLLPDGKSMECLINDDYAQFEYFYNMKLMNDQDVKEYLVVIIAGLMERGYDFIFYFDFQNNTIMQPIAQYLINFLNMNLGLLFYDAACIQQNPQALFYQSMRPEAMYANKKAIDAYGYSNKKPSLFQQF